MAGERYDWYDDSPLSIGLPLPLTNGGQGAIDALLREAIAEQCAPGRPKEREYIPLPLCIRNDATRIGDIPVSSSDAEEAAPKQAEAEAQRAPPIGERIEGKGVYLGAWKPQARDGKSLGKAFAVYAAPEDLTDESGAKLVETFQDHAKRMTALKGWHGHDGFDRTNDAAIYQGLADGSAVGKWFIPTRELLTGTNCNDDKVQDGNLLAHKDQLGKITISRKGGCGVDEYPNYYVSSTVHRGGRSRYVWCARPADGDEGWHYGGNDRMSCRPVRVEVLTL